MLHPQFKFWSLQPFNSSLQKAATKSTKFFSSPLKLDFCSTPNSDFVLAAHQLSQEFVESQIQILCLSPFNSSLQKAAIASKKLSNSSPLPLHQRIYSILQSKKDFRSIPNSNFVLSVFQLFTSNSRHCIKEISNSSIKSRHYFKEVVNTNKSFS